MKKRTHKRYTDQAKKGDRQRRGTVALQRTSAKGSTSPNKKLLVTEPVDEKKLVQGNSNQEFKEPPQKVSSELPDANEPEAKTKFEPVNVTKKPAICKGRKKSGLKWAKRDDEELATNGVDLDERDPAKRSLEGSDGHQSSDSEGSQGTGDSLPKANEIEDHTKFEAVCAVKKPAHCKKKSRLRWKGGEEATQEEAACDATNVTQEITIETGNAESESPTVPRKRKKSPSKGGVVKKKSKRGERKDVSQPTVEDRVEKAEERRPEKITRTPTYSPSAVPATPSDLPLAPPPSVQRVCYAPVKEQSDEEKATTLLAFARDSSLFSETIPPAEVQCFSALVNKKATPEQAQWARQMIEFTVDSMISKLGESTLDDKLSIFLADRKHAFEVMSSVLYANPALLPPSWYTSKELPPIKEKETKEEKKVEKGESKDMQKEDQVRAKKKDLSDKKTSKKPTEKSSSKSSKSRKSEEKKAKLKEDGNEAKKKEPEISKEDREREEKAWKQAEEEQQSFIAFMLPAAYRFFKFW